MKAGLIILVAMFLVGCAGKGIEFKLETENSKCGMKNIDFSTDYQVKGLEITRGIEGGGEQAGGEGCGGSYKVTLDEGTTKDAQMGVMLEMFRMLMTLVPGAQVPAPPPDSN